MQLLLSLLYYVVWVYSLVVWARLILEFVLSLARNWRPRGFLVVIVEIIFTVTDPPIKFFRKLIKPVNIGGISLDFGILLTLISCNVVMSILNSLG